MQYLGLIWLGLVDLNDCPGTQMVILSGVDPKVRGCESYLGHFVFTTQFDQEESLVIQNNHSS